MYLVLFTRESTDLKYVLGIILTTVLYGCEVGFFSYTENGVLRTEGRGSICAQWGRDMTSGEHILNVQRGFITCIVGQLMVMN